MYPTTPKVCCRATCRKLQFKLATSCTPDRRLVESITNDGYYRDMLLSQQLLSVMRDVLGDFFIFQHDSAPAHRARHSVQFLEQSTPGFIPPDLRPPNSTDLNPVDYIQQ